jgi:L-ascorbate metabolism protein UlaG (beta-lactamase superfamily)
MPHQIRTTRRNPARVARQRGSRSPDVRTQVPEPTSTQVFTATARVGALMKLTKYGHSCVRVEGPGGVLVIDPGDLSEDAAIVGADGLLITHEHFDHFSPGRVRGAVEHNPRLTVWTVASVAEQLTGLPRIHAVGHGDAFTAAGFDIEAHGTWHAEIHPDVPRVTNTGFLIEQRLFHPGDALTVPDKPVDTLMLPVHAAWSRTSELIDWVREVAPRRAVAIHDGALNNVGLAILDGFLGDHGPGIGSTYLAIAPHDHLDDI